MCPISLISGIIVATNGMLSINADAIALIQRIIIAVNVTSPLVTLIASSANIFITPVSTSAPTRINNPPKKNIASHSTLLSILAIISSLCEKVINSNKLAPVNAAVADSRPNIPWNANRLIVIAKTNRHFLSRSGFVICSFSLRRITFSCNSGCV